MKRYSWRNRAAIADVVSEKLFLITAFASLLILFFIMLFLVMEGLPLFRDVNPLDFLTGTEWYPVSRQPRFGVLPLVLASVYITVLASLIAVPFSMAVAIYISELASSGFRALVKPFIEIIASLPSIAVGFFGMAVLAPFLQTVFSVDSGLNVLNASLMLAFMAVPTIASIAEDALSSVPGSLKEASLSLGANRYQTLMRVVIPAASSGILTAVVLGISRVIGETMVVLMVSGGAAIIPHSIFYPARPLTSNIAAEMAEAPVGGIHYHALFATGILLFIITLFFNMLAGYLASRYRLRTDG